MFRSLFIGFLILSALTAKGAETQVADNINNIPAEALPGFFGTIPRQAEKTAAGIISAGAGKAFFSCDTIDGKAGGLLPGTANKGAALVVWLGDNYRWDYRPMCAGTLLEKARSSADEAFYCVSGLSPPCFVENV